MASLRGPRHAALGEARDMPCMEDAVTDPVTVRVGRRDQNAPPRAARECLNIRRGNRMLVDVRDGLLILVSQLRDVTSHMAGLHREVWQGLDTTVYLGEQRDASAADLPPGRFGVG